MKAWVTPEQRLMLRARAAVLGVSVSRLLVESALMGDVESRREGLDLAGEIMRTHHTFAGVANNLNQLARFANTEGAFPEEAAALAQRLDELTVMLEQAAGRLAQL